MSDDRPGMGLPFQNVHHASISPVSRMYQNSIAGALNNDSTSNAMGVSGAHFGEHELPYINLAKQDTKTLIDNRRASSVSQHPTKSPNVVSASPSHTATPVSLFTSSLVTGQVSQRTSIDNTDHLHGENDTPSSNFVEEAATSDFDVPSQTHADGNDSVDRSNDGQDATQPVWSELKTKAGKDRKRLPLACIACRRKKIRCSGEKPACKHCMRSRIPCVYKVTTRKAAPRTDYMAMLDKRLKRMEERIIKILPKSEQGSVSAIPRAVVKPAMLGAGAAASARSGPKKRNADDAFGPDLEAWARAPQLQSADNESESIDGQETEESQLLREGVDSLPPKDIQEHLAEVFFDNVYGQAYHLLHKPSYMRKLRNETLPPVLILSVCAIAARFTSNPKLNSTSKQFMRGEEWASTARDICTKRYDWPNITILTCLLILGMHEFGTCQGGRAWALGGQAIRMAFALHLHKDLEYDPQARNKKTRLSFIDREIRRRTMWACFMMDRFNSSGTDRPIFIREETMRIPLPVGERYFQLDMPAQAEYLDGGVPTCELPEEAQLRGPRESMGVSAFTIRSISIWGRIITYINQGGKEADPHPMWSAESDYSKLVRETEELLRTLPVEMQYSRKNLEIHRTEKTASQLLFLHMSIQQNLLFLNQAAVTFVQDRTGKPAPKDFVLQSSAKTFFAANRISDLLREAEDAQCHISTPFAGYCAFSSTAIHITGIFSGNPTMKATSEVNSGINVKFLRKMMKYWGMFHWMVENIRTQYRNALDAARTGGPTHGSTASSPILQYSDWFNRYPHGVSDPDYMDPAMYRKKEKGEDGVLEQKPELQTVGEFFTTVGQNAEGKDGSRPVQKRKASKRPSNVMVERTDDRNSTEMKSQSPGQNEAQQQQQQPQHQQKHQHQTQDLLSDRSQDGLLGGQTDSLGYGLSNVSQPQPTHCVTLSTNHVPSFSQPMGLPISMPMPMPMPMMGQAGGFFSTDLLSMNLGRPPDSLLQSLDRQFAYGGFSDADLGVMGGFGWDMSSQAGQGDTHKGRGCKSDESQYSEGMNLCQEVSGGWFMPVEPNDMGLGGDGASGDVHGFGMFESPSMPLMKDGDG